MKAENDRLQGEVEKLRQKLREEITRTQANVRLDLHLEKGRIRDEASAQEIKIKETDTRIESEIAGLRTQMEAIKFQILQYMIGKYYMWGILWASWLIIIFLYIHCRYNHWCWSFIPRIPPHVPMTNQLLLATASR